MKHNILICIDRDGTMIYDDKYYLGRTNDWKKKIKFLKGLIKGLKELNKKLPLAKIYMITNQSGVTIKDFPLLTEKRASEVCKTIIQILKKKEVRIDGYVICPHVSPNYVKKKNFNFERKLICNCSCIKPSPGMVKEALKNEGFRQKNTSIFVIGDRKIDVETAHNIAGTGILVPFKNESDEDINLMKHKRNKYYYNMDNSVDSNRYFRNYPDRDSDKASVTIIGMLCKTYIAKNFLDAIKYVIKRENRSDLS